MSYCDKYKNINDDDELSTINERIENMILNINKTFEELKSKYQTLNDKLDKLEMRTRPPSSITYPVTSCYIYEESEKSEDESSEDFPNDWFY